MLRSALLLLLALPCLAVAAPALNVQNDGGRVYQPVIQVAAPGEEVTALTGPDGTVCPVQPVGEGQVLVLVPGALSAGEAVKLTPSAPTEAPRTDLYVDTTDTTITVGNSFLGLTFPKTGNGGMPTVFDYPVSGQTETRFEWIDRLFEKGQGQIMLTADRKASAEVVEEGPLQVTVQSTAAYRRGDEALGQSRVVYRWTFRAYSPIVAVSASVSREDDFAWSELHILQIARKDDGLKNWAGEDQDIASGRLLDDKSFRGFGRWAAVDDGQNAVAIAWDGTGVTLYDGRSEYFTYLQWCEGFAEKSKELTGRLYIGPALAPAGYKEQFTRPALTAQWGDIIEPGRQILNYPITRFGNERVALTFNEATFGCAGIADKASEYQYLSQIGPAPLVWRLTLRDAEGNDKVIDSNVACQDRTMGMSADQSTRFLEWKGIEVGDGQEALSAKVTIRCPAGDRRTYWSLDVDNRSEKWSLIDVDFPVFVGLSNKPGVKAAVPRSNWGRLNGDFPQGGSYPSADWPMQFVSVHDGDHGLYLGYEDPRNFTKRFVYNPSSEFFFRTLAEDATRPGNDFSSPGPVVVAPCEDWWDACKLYRGWALGQTWTREGPLTQRKSTPETCKNLGLWFCGGGTSDEVISNMRRAADFFGVPVGMHWYCWHRWPFDTHYPDYFPAVPDFKIAIDALVPEGKVIMPYINGRLYDKALEGFSEDIKWCTKLPDGTPYEEVYPSQAKQSIMCPATAFWQDKISGVCEHLAGFYGVNGIYIDQIGAAGPCPCYDAGHGHPLGGGSYWVDGYRVLLEKVQQAAHRDGRDVLITTENNAEPYMDGVDCFLIWNPRMPDEIPMMTAVYSGYSLYFASNARCNPGLQPYAMIEGRDFIWGSQMGWMGFEDANPNERGNYLRDLVRLRHAALKYVVYGEVVGELRIPESVGTVTGAWHNWDGKPFDATLPAVMGNVWKGSDGSLGLLMANLSPDTKVFDYEVDTEKYGDLAGEGECLLLTDIRKEGETPAGFSPTRMLRRTEVLRPWQAKVLQITRVAAADAVKAPERPVSPSDAERASAEAWAAQKGVEWKLSIPSVHSAPRDMAQVVFGLKPGAGLPTASAVASFLGSNVRSDLGPDPENPGWLKCAVPIEVPASVRPGDKLPVTATLRLAPEQAITVPFEISIVPEVVVDVQPVSGALRVGEDVVFRVTVTNNLASTLPARTPVRLDAPASWELWPGRGLSFGPVPPHGTAERLVRCSIPADAIPGATGLTAFVVRAQAARSVDVAGPRPKAQALRLTPNVDGNLAEWTQEPTVTLGPEQAAKVDAYDGPDDLSARVWIAADDEFCYIAADVTDDVHVQKNTTKMMWNGDCLQVDLRPGVPPSRNNFDGVCEIGLALTDVGPQLWQWTPAERLVEDGKVAIVRDGTHTRYEAAVPWSALPRVSNAPGAVNAFSLTVNEADGDTFGGWLEWTPGICGSKDSSQFGKILF